MWRRWFFPLVVLLGAWLTIRGAQAQPLLPSRGSGALTVVTFSPVQAGTTTLALQRAQSTDTLGALIPVESEDGSITVVAALYGDVDGDCDVDVEDIMLVAARWGATVVELRSYFGSNRYWVIQFHGMAVDSCSENVHMSNGFTTLPPQAPGSGNCTRRCMPTIPPGPLP